MTCDPGNRGRDATVRNASFYRPAGSTTVKRLLLSDALPPAGFIIRLATVPSFGESLVVACGATTPTIARYIALGPTTTTRAITADTFVSASTYDVVFTVTSTSAWATAGDATSAGTVRCSVRSSFDTSGASGIVFQVPLILVSASLPLVGDVIAEVPGAAQTRLRSVLAGGGIVSFDTAIDTYAAAVITAVARSPTVRSPNAVPALTLALAAPTNLTLVSSAAVAAVRATHGNAAGAREPAFATAFPPGTRVFFGRYEAVVLAIASDGSTLRFTSPSFRQYCVANGFETLIVSDVNQCTQLAFFELAPDVADFEVAEEQMVGRLRIGVVTAVIAVDSIRRSAGHHQVFNHQIANPGQQQRGRAASDLRAFFSGNSAQPDGRIGGSEHATEAISRRMNAGQQPNGIAWTHPLKRSGNGAKRSDPGARSGRVVARRRHKEFA